MGNTGVCHAKETMDRQAYDAADNGAVERYGRARRSASVPRTVAHTTISCGRFAEGLSHKRPTS